MTPFAVKVTALKKDRCAHSLAVNEGASLNIKYCCFYDDTSFLIVCFITFNEHFYNDFKSFKEAFKIYALVSLVGCAVSAWKWGCTMLCGCACFNTAW